MQKSDYLIPNEEWLLAEMEIILGFFIMYQNGTDIEESESFLAGKYKITESKAKRLKIKFAKRYAKNHDPAQEITRASPLFGVSKHPFELNEDGKTVSFMVKDPAT
jgi:hypothetical protein